MACPGFLHDGRVEIDSNGVENPIRPLALNRKNALFAGHDEGGKAWGRIASLIETAKINGVEPFAHLKATLEATASGHPQSRIDDPLPRNFTPSSRNKRVAQLTLTIGRRASVSGRAVTCSTTRSGKSACASVSTPRDRLTIRYAPLRTSPTTCAGVP